MSRLVRKSAIQVEISRVGQSPVIGALFLTSRKRPGPVPETLIDYLNRTDERMIPFERRSDGAMLLVARRHMEWVRLLSSQDCEPEHSPDLRLTREELVRVRFNSGSEIEGLIQMDLHETSSRASDFINGEDSFFPLFTPSGLCHVNKECILEVRVFEISPLPPLSEPVNGRQMFSRRQSN